MFGDDMKPWRKGEPAPDHARGLTGEELSVIDGAIQHAQGEGSDFAGLHVEYLAIVAASYRAQAARITSLERALGVADSVVKALASMEHANGRRYCTLCGAWDGEAHGDDCLHSDYLRARALQQGEKGR